METLTMQEKKPKNNKKIMLILILILPVTAYLIFTTIVTFNYYGNQDKNKVDIPEIMPEASNESNKKYSDQMRPSGMMLIEIPVSNKNIEDKEFLSSWPYEYDCFVDLMINDAFLFRHIRVIDFLADKTDPNKTNVTFSLSMRQVESIESAGQNITGMTVYIKKEDKGREPSVLDIPFKKTQLPLIRFLKKRPSVPF
jgi:hypothetical protein